MELSTEAKEVIVDVGSGRAPRLPDAQREYREEKSRVSEKTVFTPSSGNAFADLGLPNADEEMAKVELAFEIGRIIEERGLTQVEAAELIGVDRPKVSAVVRYRLDGFSMERLYRVLNALGRDIEIIVKPKPKSRKEATLKLTRRAGSVAGTTAWEGLKTRVRAYRRKSGQNSKQGAAKERSGLHLAD